MLSSINYNNLDHHKDYQQIYYNLDILNSRNTTTGNINDDPIASFSETRDTPIISDASKYKMSIIRFTMNGIKDLPLFIPIIEENQPNRNKTIYKITIKTDTNTYTQNIIYEPQNDNLTISNASLVNQSFDDPYYYINTYQHFLNLINKTFIDIIDVINTTETETYNYPVMVYDNNTKKFSLYLPDETFDTFFNSNLFNLFSNFTHSKKLNNDNEAFKLLKNNPLDLNKVTINGVDYIKLTQEYQSVGTYWSPIESIVFTSNLLPIVPENVAPTSIFKKSNTTAEIVSSSYNFEPIVTDIALTLDDAYDYKQFISYIPTSQYRYVSFTNSNQPIKNININIFWKCRYNSQLIPLRMSNLSNISLKMLFEKK